MKTIAKRIKILENLDESAPQELARELGRGLNDRSPTIRGLAVELVGDRNLVGILPDVIPLLEDRDSEVRALAIESITKLAKSDLPVKSIARCLFDKDELVRIAAAEALAEFGNAAALIDLYTALQDKAPLVRAYVAEAIGAIGAKESVSVLEKHLSDENDDRAKVGFYIGLHKLGQNNRLADLIDFLRNEDYRIRSAVTNSFSILGLSKPEILQVIDRLAALKTKEETIAVKSSIEAALEDLYEKENSTS
jgi:HEAT repeat protein